MGDLSNKFFKYIYCTKDKLEALCLRPWSKLDVAHLAHPFSVGLPLGPDPRVGGPSVVGDEEVARILYPIVRSIDIVAQIDEVSTQRAIALVAILLLLCRDLWRPG